MKPTQVAGVQLSNPERVLFPDTGATKRQLAEYYERIADWIVPHVSGRLATVVRCPGGLDEKCFYQKHYDEGFPEPVAGFPLQEKDGEEATYLLINDLSGLVGFVQIGVMEVHSWGSRVEALESPDRLVFDLDPGPGLGWKEVVSAAGRVREQLEQLRLSSFVKTTGGNGVHIVVPLAPRGDWEQAHAFSEAIANSIAEQDPERYIATASKAKRQRKVFIDYLRNTRGATSVAPYSTRARPGAPVSTPLRWDELPSLESSQAYNIENLPRRLAALKNDPWDGFFNLEQSIPEERT